jgi:histidinol-phosphate aminotransferase
MPIEQGPRGMSVEQLARPEIRDLHPYETTYQMDGALRLHANESPWSGTDGPGFLNHYPEIRPTELQERLADRFDVATDNLLTTRGSTEAIDLLMCTFCRAGKDNIVTTPPTFVMFQVYAEIQGAETIACPLSAEQDFAFDASAVLDKCTPLTKLIFVCTPNNPTGSVVSRNDITRLLTARKDQSVIVADEAYIEFSESASASDLVTKHDNLVVLRTLSKALGLAGTRCGVAIGDAGLIRMLNGVLPPYAMATPVVDCVMRALSTEAVNASRIAEIIAERERLAERLSHNSLVEKVWPSEANFLLVRFHDLEMINDRLQREKILIREFGDKTGLENCARITVAKPDENERLLAALDD